MPLIISKIIINYRIIIVINITIIIRNIKFEGLIRNNKAIY